MYNLQLNIAIGLTVIAILTSLTVSLVQISAIREENAHQHAIYTRGHPGNPVGHQTAHRQSI
jgi:hypothetical protein